MGEEGSTLVIGPYHYGSHYSNSGTVLQYLVRLPPFTQMFLHYQGRTDTYVELDNGGGGGGNDDYDDCDMMILVVVMMMMTMMIMMMMIVI